MIRTILILIIPFILSAQIKYKVGSNPNIIKVGTNEKYKTIASALDDWSAGYIIQLAPESFNENITLSDSGVYIYGINKELTSINKLQLDGIDCHIENISVIDTLKLLCQEGILEERKGTKFINCNFYGDCLFGEDGTTLKEKFLLQDCNFIGTNKKLYFNIESNAILSLGYWSNFFINCYVKSPSSIDSTNYDIYIENGGAVFRSCNNLNFYNIYFDNTESHAVELRFEYCRWINFLNGITATSSDDYVSVFVISESQFNMNVPWIIQGRFEFDVWNSSGFMEDITFNSSAYSRINYFQEMGYENDAIIQGDSLNNVFIKHSIFHCAAPAGLGEDLQNSWESFIDD